jgi:hypothetical protein
VRQFTVFDSLEADFRATGFEMAAERANELCAKRLKHGLGYRCIGRYRRCLVDWNDELKAEREWLRVFEESDETSQRLIREQQEAERREFAERQEETMKRAVEEEQRRKSRFLGSFGRIKWID